MSINSSHDLLGMQEASNAVAITLRKMREYAQIGMNCRELDEYGASILESFGAKSAPKLTYGFPGNTCISINHEVAHGIPSEKKILKEGDLVNIDVSAELNGYWSDNGGSFVLGQDIHMHNKLVDCSRKILASGLNQIRPGMRIAALGKFIETSARAEGFRVIKNLTGHGIGRSLHESPRSIPNYYERMNHSKFKKNMVVAVETFISTGDALAHETGDGWTLVTKNKSFVAQHEHTIVITDGAPIILTAENNILN